MDDDYANELVVAVQYEGIAVSGVRKVNLLVYAASQLRDQPFVLKGMSFADCLTAAAATHNISEI